MKHRYEWHFTNESGVKVEGELISSIMYEGYSSIREAVKRSLKPKVIENFHVTKYSEEG